jgi:hypothetical protein
LHRAIHGNKKKSLRLASSNPPVLSLVFPGRDTTDYLTKGILPQMVALRNSISTIDSSTERHTSIMVYCTSRKPTIKVAVNLKRKLPIVLVNESGKILTRGCFRYLFGPSIYVLVASPFPSLYYIVLGDRCTCVERTQCEHVQEGQLVNAIRFGRLVQVTWHDLTAAEKRAAYDVLFESCDLEARWEAAQW